MNVVLVVVYLLCWKRRWMMMVLVMVIRSWSIFCSCGLGWWMDLFLTKNYFLFFICG